MCSGNQGERKIQHTNQMSTTESREA